MRSNVFRVWLIVLFVFNIYQMVIWSVITTRQPISFETSTNHGFCEFESRWWAAGKHANPLSLQIARWRVWESVSGTINVPQMTYLSASMCSVFVYRLCFANSLDIVPHACTEHYDFDVNAHHVLSVLSALCVWVWINICAHATCQTYKMAHDWYTMQNHLSAKSAEPISVQMKCNLSANGDDSLKCARHSQHTRHTWTHFSGFRIRSSTSPVDVGVRCLSSCAILE